MKFQLNYETRQMLEVAYSVAQHVEQIQRDETAPEKGLLASRPSLLSVSNSVIRFQGGTTVDVDVVNIGDDREEWVVVGAVVRYYPYDYSSYTRSNEKVLTKLGPEELSDIRQGRHGWYHPHVKSIDELVLGEVGVFFNNAAQSGFIRANYGRNYCGHHTLYKSFPYGYAEGDEQRAREEARAYLDELSR